MSGSNECNTVCVLCTSLPLMCRGAAVALPGYVLTVRRVAGLSHMPRPCPGTQRRVLTHLSDGSDTPAMLDIITGDARDVSVGEAATKARVDAIRFYLCASWKHQQRMQVCTGCGTPGSPSVPCPFCVAGMFLRIGVAVRTHLTVWVAVSRCSNHPLSQSAVLQGWPCWLRQSPQADCGNHLFSQDASKYMHL